MKNNNMKVFLITLIGFFLSFCCANKRECKEATNVEKIIFDTVVVWVECDYLKCIRSNLPSDCCDDVSMPLLTYFERKDSMTFHVESNSRDNSIFHMFKSTANSYTSEDGLLKIEFNLDTLYATLISDKIKFVKQHIVINRNEDYLGQFNLQMLKKNLSIKGFDIESKLSLTGTCHIYCNMELNGLNLISQKENPQNKWIVKKKGSSFYLYRFLNGNEEKSIEPTISKELKFVVE